MEGEPGWPEAGFLSEKVPELHVRYFTQKLDRFKDNPASDEFVENGPQ
jgi:hypothetical protein